MKFMWDNRLNPSDELIEEYRQSKTTKILNLFPSYKELKQRLRMPDWLYNNLMNVYSSKHEFIYYFDSDLDIQTKFAINKNGVPCIRKGIFEKGKVKLIK